MEHAMHAVGCRAGFVVRPGSLRNEPLRPSNCPACSSRFSRHGPDHAAAQTRPRPYLLATFRSEPLTVAFCCPCTQRSTQEVLPVGTHAQVRCTQHMISQPRR